MSLALGKPATYAKDEYLENVIELLISHSERNISTGPKAAGLQFAT